MSTTTSARPRGSRRSVGASRAAAALRALSSRDCTVLGLVLVERLLPVEAAAALGITTAQLCREYEAAVARVRRALAPLVREARARTAAARPALAWRRAS